MRQHWTITDTKSGKQIPFYGTMPQATRKAQAHGFVTFKVSSYVPQNNGTLLAR